MKGEVEMDIEMEGEQENEPFHEHSRKDYHETGVVRIGDRIVETSIIEYDFVVKHWLRYIDRYYRKRCGPHVAGLAVFRGFPRPPIWSRWRRPSNPGNPIRAITLCLGGSHCLLYRDDGYEDFRTPKGLNDFFGRRNLAVVGIGVKRDAERLAAEWGIHIAHPVELRTLAARAFGSDQVWQPRHVNGRIVIKSRGLEGLAEPRWDECEKEAGERGGQRLGRGGPGGAHHVRHPGRLPLLRNRPQVPQNGRPLDLEWVGPICRHQQSNLTV